MVDWIVYIFNYFTNCNKILKYKKMVNRYKTNIEIKHNKTKLLKKFLTINTIIGKYYSCFSKIYIKWFSGLSLSYTFSI